MATILTPPALHSAEETARFIDEVLAQGKTLRAQMQDADADISRLAAETHRLRDESERLQTLQQQASNDMEAALSNLASLPSRVCLWGTMFANAQSAGDNQCH